MANKNKIISFIIFFFISIELFTALSFPTTNETDFQALLDIKSRIQSDPFHVFDSWNDSLHFCNWQGIKCGKKHRHVTVLRIPKLNLVGTLSPSVGNLSFLKKIFLYENSFHGIIPPEIGKLFRLHILVFNRNAFEGQIASILPLSTNLQVIDLSSNKLSGRIPNELSSLSKLEFLGLAQNNFIGNIPPSLGNISTLQILELTTNNLTGNIPHELSKLFNLGILGLGDNMLSGSFPVDIYNISSIRSISIGYNHLSGQFPDNLGLLLPKVTHLSVYSNNFSGSIPSTLPNASNLVMVEIGENMLTGPIPRNLGRLQQLQVLQLNKNPLGIHKDNDISIIATFTNCTNLEKLNLGETEIGGLLPLEICNLSKTLKYIYLQNNHISGNLFEGIGELVGLTLLAVSNNTLSGNIPSSIGKLKNMNKLHLSGNNFIGEIPPSIGDVSELLILNLSKNMLTGNIPLSMSNLTKLEALDLSQNHLTGSLPKDIFNEKSSLIQLFLNQNKFIGSLPLEMCNLKHLDALALFENELSGEIPKSIGDCQMLVDIELEGNFLNGTIPSSIGQLKSIEIIDLSRNNLSGEIPVSLETLKHISFLNLSFNMLEGEVPKNGVFVNASSFSIVGNGKLCGGNESMNLTVCPSKDSQKHEKLSAHIIFIIVVICILIAFVSLFGCVYAVYQRRKSRRVPSKTSTYEKELLKISYAEILKFTNGFSIENLIGEGRYGSVYRGILQPDERLVAIKVLKLQTKGAYKSFLTECEALRNIRHINLAKVITSCSSIDFKGNDFKALVLEFVPNGNLDEWMHQNQSVQVNNKKLDLFQRLNIVIDIASALDYLHNRSGNPIVHCDIKPSNVLLDNNLRGLVSDFGLAKFIQENDDKFESSSIGIRGTIGYVAPEYGMGGDVSTKGDIYSFGILLLEMFTGKRPTDTVFNEDTSIHDYVKTSLPNRVAEIIDPQLLTVEDGEESMSNYTLTRIESCCLSIFRVGVSCSSVMQNYRMDMNEALIELQHIRNKM